MLLPADTQLVGLDVCADYQAWHKGRRRYIVWYIEIDDEAVSQCCQEYQRLFDDILTPGYHRQWHITLFVNGFLVDEPYYDDDCTASQIDAQIQAVQALNLSPFGLTLDRIDGFLNSLFIAIHPNDTLLKIRQALSAIKPEIAPRDYHPHITLGFYRSSFSSGDVLPLLTPLQIPDIDFRVKTLTVGYYDPNQLQGQLTALYHISLSPTLENDSC